MSESAKGRMSKLAGRRIGERGIRFAVAVVIALAVCALAAMPAWAQEEELSISVRKQFGYSLGSQIQGTFLIRVRGPEDLAAVTFLLDGETLGEVTTAPFELSFKTDHYAPGWHQITAVGTTADGQTLTARTVSFQFVTSEAAGRGTMAIIVPVIVLTLIITVAVGLFPLLSARKTPTPVYDPASYTPEEPRHYGAFGGVVCPKCGRPFGMHLWGFNFVTGKYDRCPHCGKWSLVRRAGRKALMAAEAAEYAEHTTAAPRPVLDAEEKLREQPDDSRFTDRI